VASNRAFRQKGTVQKRKSLVFVAAAFVVDQNKTTALDRDAAIDDSDNAAAKCSSQSES